MYNTTQITVATKGDDHETQMVPMVGGRYGGDPSLVEGRLNEPPGPMPTVSGDPDENLCCYNCFCNRVMCLCCCCSPCCKNTIMRTLCGIISTLVWAIFLTIIAFVIIAWTNNWFQKYPVVVTGNPVTNAYNLAAGPPSHYVFNCDSTKIPACSPGPYMFIDVSQTFSVTSYYNIDLNLGRLNIQGFYTIAATDYYIGQAVINSLNIKKDTTSIFELRPLLGTPYIEPKSNSLVVGSMGFDCQSFSKTKVKLNAFLTLSLFSWTYDTPSVATSIDLPC